VNFYSKITKVTSFAISSYFVKVHRYFFDFCFLITKTYLVKFMFGDFMKNFLSSETAISEVS